MQHKTAQPSEEIQFLKGVGPKRAELLAKAGINSIRDLLYFFPRKYLDRTNIRKIGQLQIGEKTTVIGKVLAKGIIPGRKKIFEAIISDDTGNLSLTWFAGHKYHDNAIKKGTVLSVSGEVTEFRGPQMIHPEYEIIEGPDDADSLLHTAGIVPLYSGSAEWSRAGLNSRRIRAIMKTALEKYGHDLQDVIPEKIRTDLNLPELKQSLSDMHFPQSNDRLEKARNRFAFEELFQLQCAIAMVHQSYQKQTKKHKYSIPGDLMAKFKQNLPFKLTSAQSKVLGEIFDDMKDDHPMNRLLLGDVGSGKTIVAVASILYAVENGHQAALMAPTELLAEQHYNSISRILAEFDLNIMLLTSSLKASERKKARRMIADGDVDIVIGTHALISEGVEYHKLALVVIDEQHRFGVAQRASLRGKGDNPDLLVMTATPIPRSLALTIYGDLELSIIDKLPPGRKPVKTAIRPESAHDKIYLFLRDEIEKGNQAYIVYPLVEESEKLNLKAATEEFEKLSQDIFPDLSLALVHGRLDASRREQLTRKFRAGEINILVATTVIEVGVDVPRATVMLIENAERFGLSQLHQLRGRVGRSDAQSYCILVVGKKSSGVAKERLAVIASTNDGFKIAEFDLKLRGPGEYLGERQHGMPQFKVADIVSDLEMLKTARKYAFDIISKKIKLDGDELRKLKNEVHKSYSDMFANLTAG